MSTQQLSVGSFYLVVFLSKENPDTGVYYKVLETARTSYFCLLVFSRFHSAVALAV